MRALVFLALTGSVAASSDPGRDAAVYVAAGQFRPGAFPAASGGPAALSLQSLYPAIVIGQARQQLIAALEPAAQASRARGSSSPGRPMSTRRARRPSTRRSASITWSPGC